MSVILYQSYNESKYKKYTVWGRGAARDEYIAAYRRHTTLPFELARSVGGTGAALGAEGA